MNNSQNTKKRMSFIKGNDYSEGYANGYNKAIEEIEND